MGRCRGDDGSEGEEAEPAVFPLIRPYRSCLGCQIKDSAASTFGGIACPLGPLGGPVCDKERSRGAAEEEPRSRPSARTWTSSSVWLNMLNMSHKKGHFSKQYLSKI